MLGHSDNHAVKSGVRQRKEQLEKSRRQPRCCRNAYKSGVKSRESGHRLGHLGLSYHLQTQHSRCRKDKSECPPESIYHAWRNSPLRVLSPVIHATTWVDLRSKSNLTNGGTVRPELAWNDHLQCETVLSEEFAHVPRWPRRRFALIAPARFMAIYSEIGLRSISWSVLRNEHSRPSRSPSGALRTNKI